MPVNEEQVQWMVRQGYEYSFSRASNLLIVKLCIIILKGQILDSDLKNIKGPIYVVDM